MTAPDMAALVKFLNARLDEAAEDAQAAQGEWVEAESTEAALTHLQRWSSARVLADVEAKRRIIGEFERCESVLRMLTLVEPARSYATARRDALVPVLRLLTLPDAEHPDYREEWRPEPSWVDLTPKVRKTEDSITCPRCGRTSYSPQDIAHRFCGACGYHDDPSSP